jgi:hypothetical protein
MKKTITITLIIFFALAGLITIQFATSQTTKPSIPEFTLRIEDNGVQISIQNQPVIPNGQDDAGIFYDIRMKWHESTNWFHNTEPDPSKGIRGYVGEIGETGTTNIYVSANSYYEILGMSSSHQIDYQIRAINGYLNTTSQFVPPIGHDPNSTPVVIVDTSEWSDIHTIIVPNYIPPTVTPTPSTNPTTSPTTTLTAEPTETHSTPPNSASSIMLAVITISLVVIVLLLTVIAYLLFFIRKRKVT